MQPAEGGYAEPGRVTRDDNDVEVSELLSPAQWEKINEAIAESVEHDEPDEPEPDHHGEY
jgi:hypothetical protein